MDVYINPARACPPSPRSRPCAPPAFPLQRVGVALDAEGAIKVDDCSRTSAPGVWAVGDVTNRVNLTPVALMEGMAFAKTCFTGEETRPDYQFCPSAVFCQPPLATGTYQCHSTPLHSTLLPGSKRHACVHTRTHMRLAARQWRNPQQHMMMTMQPDSACLCAHLRSCACCLRALQWASQKRRR